MYLAARLVSKDLSRKEIIFLADLAQALGLDDALVEQLEKQAGLLILRAENIAFSDLTFH